MDANLRQYASLNSRRRELGMSYSALAELSGVSQPALQRMLTGKVDGPSLTSIASVARALGMGAVQFMDDGSIKFDSTVSVQALRSARRERRQRGWWAWSRARPHWRVRR